MTQLVGERNVSDLRDILNIISNNRNWGKKDNRSIHHPRTQFIQVDMSEFLIIRNLLPKYNNSYETLAELMFEKIRHELLIYNYAPPYSYKTWKGITIKFFDEVNGKMYKEYTF